MVSIYRSNGRAGHALRFASHFLQMFIAMGVGMAVLGIGLSVLGYGEVVRSVPELYAVIMAVAMVIPMVAWMRFRMGHGWSRTTEMSAAMTVPTLVLVVICSAGFLPHGLALAWSMPLTTAGMIADMVYRWNDYA